MSSAAVVIGALRVKYGPERTEHSLGLYIGLNSVIMNSIFYIYKHVQQIIYL